MSSIRFDYSRLRGRIKEVCGTQDVFSDKISLGRVSVSQRLSNNLGFSQMEMLKSADVLQFRWLTSRFIFYPRSTESRTKNVNGQSVYMQEVRRWMVLWGGIHGGIEGINGKEASMGSPSCFSFLIKS